MRTEDQGSTIRHVVELVDEDRAACAQAVDNEAVVHDFMAHVDGCAEGFERAFDDLDRAIDAGTETTGVGEQDFHGAILPRWRLVALSQVRPKPTGNFGANADCRVGDVE